MIAISKWLEESGGKKAKQRDGLISCAGILFVEEGAARVGMQQLLQRTVTTSVSIVSTGVATEFTLDLSKDGADHDACVPVLHDPTSVDVRLFSI